MKAFRTALVTIVETDGPQGTPGTIQNLCGRTSKLIRIPVPLDDRTVFPLVTYMLVTATQGAGSRDQRAPSVQLDCWATEATGGIAKAEDLAARLEIILAEPAFRAQNVDVAPGLVRRRDGFETEQDLALGRRRVICEIDFAFQRG